MLELLRTPPQPSFDDTWYRVGPTRPRLSVHARVIRQAFGDDTVYIVEEPASGAYYRLTEAAYFFLGMLEGARTVDDAWQACAAQLGDGAPTQRECVELLARLQLFGVLAGDQPIAPDMVPLRQREQAAKRRQRRLGRGVSFTIPLLNPEPVLARAAHLIQPLFSRWGLAIYLCVLGAGIVAIARNAGEIGSQLNGVLDPANLLVLSGVFVLLRAWHELGHAAACKAMGGRCTEIGLILFAFVLPFPYCDASSAWRFPEIWRRVVVGLGGVLFETFIAGLAAVVWASTLDQPGSLLRAISFNIILISGVATVLFNLNPLLRYDGYYVLSDLLGVANMWQRSRELWQFLVERVAFGVRSVRAPFVRSRAEAWLLLVFGALSLPYRVFITVTILVLIASEYLSLGIALAVILGVMWLAWPLAKLVWYLGTAPKLMNRRPRACAISLAVLGIPLLALGLIPAPAGAIATGTLEPETQDPVRTPEDGFIAELLAKPDEFVRRDQPLLRLHNIDIESEHERAQAARRRAQIEADAYLVRPGAERAEADIALRLAEDAERRARQRFESLIIRAPGDGRFLDRFPTPSGLTSGLGAFVSKGTLLGSVASTDRFVVRASLSDSDHAFVFRRALKDDGAAGEVGAAVRFRGAAGDVVPARVVRVQPAGSRQVAAPSLRAESGGDVVMDPTDREAARTLVPQFVVEVRPERGPGVVGLRARVRLGAPDEPLLSQWWRLARQYLGDRLR